MRYMKSDITRLLSVSREAMGVLRWPWETPAPDARIECESAGAPPEMAERINLPTWSGYLRMHVRGRERKRKEVENLFVAATLRPLSSARLPCLCIQAGKVSLGITNLRCCEGNFYS
jgi:hypothetical protein